MADTIHALGFPQTVGNGWSPELGFAVIIAYIIGFALLARTKANRFSVMNKAYCDESSV
jgi:hypothetical protein